MKNFADRLTDAIREKNNPTVLGLDPQLSYLPPALLDLANEQTRDPQKGAGLAVTLFNKRLIDALYEIVPAVKLQLACYEQLGLPGLNALKETIGYAQQQGLIVIADGKRNDIGSSASGYAGAFLAEDAPFGADALTINGYLGLDGVSPFLESCRKQQRGVFILVRTSNPSAGDLQDLVLEDQRTVADAMADLVHTWGLDLIGTSGYSSVGAVIGATWPQQARALRQRMPHAFFLIPGYGAQGALARDAVSGFSADGGGAIINASRSLMLAWQKHRLEADLFDQAARLEALAMRTSLREALKLKALGDNHG